MEEKAKRKSQEVDEEYRQVCAVIGDIEAKANTLLPAYYAKAAALLQEGIEAREAEMKDAKDSK